MARFKHGPNGPYSGKVGSVVGSSWRDIYYIKGRQKKSTKERSPDQLAQQAKFAMMVKLLHPVKNLLNMTFGHINTGGSTGYNMALSHNLLHAIKGTYPELEIDYPAVSFARGKVTPPREAEVLMEDGLVIVKWNTEFDKVRSFPDDRVRIMMYRPEDRFYNDPDERYQRIHGQADITQYIEPGAPYHVYLYLNERMGKHLANSIYVGTIQI